MLCISRPPKPPYCPLVYMTSFAYMTSFDHMTSFGYMASFDHMTSFGYMTCVQRLQHEGSV